VYKVAGKWDPFEWLAIRGSFGTNYATPPNTTPGSPSEGLHKTYIADASFATTTLFFVVEFRAADPFVPCSGPGQDCQYRQFPDGTVAAVIRHPETDMAMLSLTARRPDGTAVWVFADGLETPDLSVEDMFRFATVFTY